MPRWYSGSASGAQIFSLGTVQQGSGLLSGGSLLFALGEHLFLGLVRHEVASTAAAAGRALEVQVDSPDDKNDSERYDDQGNGGL